MSKTQLFVAGFVITMLSFSVGFIAGYHYDPPVKSQSTGQQQYYSTKSYTLDLQSKMPFGKHKGKSVLDVIEEEPDYLAWMMREVKRVSFTEDVKAALAEKDM